MAKFDLKKIIKMGVGVGSAFIPGAGPIVEMVRGIISDDDKDNSEAIEAIAEAIEEVTEAISEERGKRKKLEEELAKFKKEFEAFKKSAKK